MDISGDYTHSQLFFSNSVEKLFEKLKERLFHHGSSPFSKRLVIVPSPAMEGWIRGCLAQELGIAAGIETSFLDKALHTLFEMEPFPGKLELLLLIEAELEELKEEWEPLKKYLCGKEKRTVALSQRLAQLFIRYGIYGHAAPSRWEKKPKSWQEELWRRVFKKRTYPLKMLPGLKLKECNASIHLFAFSHLPPLYFHFFQQLPSVHFYQLSPCREFWSDLSVEHPLLTHFGRLGREMARLIEESDLVVEEVYEVPQKESQLHRFQRELLDLERYDRVEDDSIELHLSSTRHHEIQNLRRTLITLLNESEWEPRDILVMAPDIALYEPYIRALFQDLPYQIADMPMQQKDPEIEGLSLLLDLEKRRFSAPALLELFCHPLFRKKRGWNEEDLLQIREWIEETGIRWGLDEKNRDALLKKRHCVNGVADEGATWKAGIDHLIEELAITHNPKRIDFTQAELLGEWKQAVDSIASDFISLREGRTLREWADWLKALHAKYFSTSDRVVHYVETLAYAGRDLDGRRYSFETLRQLLQEVIGEKSLTVNAQRIQAVRFCSMLPMRAIPAKVICLIGLNHDAFPRKESLFSLDLLKEEGDYAPSRLDFDRYLFLEALLSAREKIIISYLGCDPYDLTPWPPSSVVTHLLPYISKRVEHPFHAPLKEKRAAPPLFTFHRSKIEIPPCRIELTDLVRAFRSPLRHYLYHQEIYVRDEKILQEEEAFRLSPLRKAILRKSAEEAFRKAKREGDFPIGTYGLLAERQLREEIDALPKNLETLPVDLTIGNVQIVGMLEGVMQDGLCLFEEKKIKGAARNWPLFLVLTKIRPESSSCLFARDGKKTERFFDDPQPYLKAALEYYFLAQKIPAPLFPEWIEPILKEDPAKLEKAKSFDPALQWALRGQRLLSPQELISSWKEEAEKLYKEMTDAWF
ncbi:MAG: exodeoxyribonuclease V subunit gamma [Chlamydiales bacterium]|nr:exodeoxyribonuclease V subunit gamma [Chlamydiales bacterium]